MSSRGAASAAGVGGSGLLTSVSSSSTPEPPQVIAHPLRAPFRDRRHTTSGFDIRS